MLAPQVQEVLKDAREEGARPLHLQEMLHAAVELSKVRCIPHTLAQPRFAQVWWELAARACS